MYHYVNITENFVENVALGDNLYPADNICDPYIWTVYLLWNFMYCLLVCGEFWMEDLQDCIAIVIENVQNCHTNTALQDLKPHY